LLNTFAAVARRWHADNLSRWKPNHAGRIMRYFETDVFPLIGETPIAELRVRDIKAVIDSVAARGVIEMAEKIRQWINSICNYAAMLEIIDGNPAAPLAGYLKKTDTAHMPALPRLWAFMQTADIVTTRKMNAEQYKRAGRNVAALALSMRGALEGENAAPQPGQRSMNFVMPLFMGEAEYPAYIHVYDESHEDEGSEQIKKETWLRICVLTDHIGMVELINRIYEETHVDMRLYFSDPDAAWEFRSHLDDIRASAEDTPIVIEGIQIGAIGERRFFTN